MSDEKISMHLDTDPQVARLIIDTAEYLAKSPPKNLTDAMVDGEVKYYAMRVDQEFVKEAADLVFLAMSLIAEKRDR